MSPPSAARVVAWLGVKRIIVCAAQVPFVAGGAEALTRSLVEQLRRRGHATDLVALPLAWHPRRELFAHAAAWRMLNLRTAGAP